jgi:hypothetical protein
MTILYSVLNDPVAMERLKKAGYTRQQIKEMLDQSKSVPPDFTYRGKQKTKTRRIK